MDVVTLVFFLLQVLLQYTAHAATEPALCGSVSLVEDSSYDWNGAIRAGEDNIMICNSAWNINTARVICRELGFTGVLDYTPLSVSEGVMGYSGIVCQDNDTLCDCNWDNSMIITCPEGLVGRVVCKVEEEPNHMELVGGNFQWEGTAVLTVNGVGGTLCSDSADINVATVICRQLGFSRALHFFLRSQYESSVEGPKWLGSIDCDGNEESILLCSHSGIGQVQSCVAQKNLGIICDGGLPVNTVPVRLTDGAESDNEGIVGDNNEGIVEVFYTGIWGTICNRDWTWMDANVVCTQLGYGPLIEMTQAGDYPSAQASDVILTTGFGCNGHEQTLTQCQSINWDFTGCSPLDIVGVKCSELVPIPKYIRLADGGSGSDKNVEFFMSDVWGSVCANNWDHNDGDVICRQLGYAGVNEVTTSNIIVDGTQVAWIDDMECDGDENELRDCPFTRKNSGVCDNGEVASIICSSTPIAGSFRLNGGQSLTEGTVDLFKNNMWMPICGNNWGRKDGDIVCRELGYLRSLTTGATTSTPRKSIRIDCGGEESSFSLCSESVVSACINHANVSCTDEPELPVRLQGDDDEARGRVEVFYRGTWGTICDSDWNTVAAGEVVCRQLGFSGVDDRQIGTYRADELTPIWLTDVQCEGSEVMLSECNLGEYGLQQCVPQHSNDAAVVCRVDEDSRPIRLVGGTASSVGRLEVFSDGTWGSICDQNFGMPDAVVACRKLGFTGLIRVGEEGEYGVSEGPILLTDIECNGDEASLDECSSDPAIEETDCTHREDVGIVCDTNPGTEGDIRLLDNELSQPNSRKVEIFHDNFWGGICDESWLHSDAEVVCRQLGFLGGTAEEADTLTSTVGWLHSVSCNGTEDRLEDCSHGEWRLNSVCPIVEVTCEVPPEPTPTLSPEISSSSSHLVNPTNTYTTTLQSPDPTGGDVTVSTGGAVEEPGFPVNIVAIAVPSATLVVALAIAVLLVITIISRRLKRTKRTVVGDKSTTSASTEEGGAEWTLAQGVSNQLFDASLSTEYPMTGLKPHTLSLKTDAEASCNDPPSPTHHTEVSL